MKIHFIKTPDTKDIYPHMGFSYIMAHLRKQGFDVEYIDTNLINFPYEKLAANPRACINEPPDWDAIKKYFIDKDIRIAFLTGGFTNHISKTGRFAELLKELYPGSKVITGGVHSSALPKETLEKFKSIDYIILGDGEYVALELANRIIDDKPIETLDSIAYRENGSVIINELVKPIMELDKLVFPAKDLWPIDEYRRVWRYLQPGRDPLGLIVSTRGCPGKCLFCASGRDAALNKLRLRSSANIIAEIDELINKYRIKTIEFMDDCFTVSHNRLIELSEYLSDKKLPWICKSRVDTINPDVLRLMKRSGCRRVFIGIESIDKNVLESMGKRVSPAKITESLNMFKKAGIEVAASFTIGHPNETKESMLETVNFAKRLAAKGIPAGLYLITPYPGCQLYDMAVQNGWLYDNNWDAFDQLGKSKPIYAPGGWTPDSLMKFYKDAWKQIDRAHILSVMANPLNWVKRISRIRSLKDIKSAVSPLVNIFKRQAVKV